MKLIRFGAVGNEKPGVELNDGTRLDVSGFGQDFDQDFFGKEGVSQLKNWLQIHEKDCTVSKKSCLFLHS